MYIQIISTIYSSNKGRKHKKDRGKNIRDIYTHYCAFLYKTLITKKRRLTTNIKQKDKQNTTLFIPSNVIRTKIETN